MISRHFGYWSVVHRRILRPFREPMHDVRLMTEEGHTVPHGPNETPSLAMANREAARLVSMLPCSDCRHIECGHARMYIEVRRYYEENP